MNWLVFNYLIGNADSHGKNISLLLTEQGPKLAPFYDLLCTKLYAELTDRLAMRIGGEDRPDWIIARKWQELAEEISMGFRLVEQTLNKMAGQIGQQAGQLAAELSTNKDDEAFYQRIIDIIEQRKQKIERAFAAAGDRCRGSNFKGLTP